MKSIKKSLRMMGYVFLIILASVGLGISGAITVNSDKRNYAKQINNIEQVEKKEEKEKDSEFRVG